MNDPLDTRPPALLPVPSRRDRLVSLLLACLVGWLMGYRAGVYQDSPRR